jgi:hypothetical protein
MQITSQPSYLNRDFNAINQEIETLLKIYYPEQWQDFNVVSAGMALVDLLAYTTDILSFYTDKRFNQLFVDGVDEIEGAFRLAKTLGFKPQGNNAAVTLAQISVKVPISGNGPDPDYLPLVQPGMQVVGNAQIFETLFEIDFSNDFSEEGIANRTIIPNYDNNQNIINYTITKLEKISAGSTKIFSVPISNEMASAPFYQLTLSDNNVLEIVSVIAIPGAPIGVPSFENFSDSNLRYYEVEYLAQDKVFLPTTAPTLNGIKEGNYVTVNKRFTKDFNANGSCNLTFGGGDFNMNAYQNYLNSIRLGQDYPTIVTDFFNNTALGYKLPANSTLYVKYRVGGGAGSNVGINTLSQVANVNMNVVGADPTFINQIQTSFAAQNILPALGGTDPLTVEELKQYISANYASQDRCVTLNDYIARAYQMPGQFGRPFRIHGEVNDNKIIMYVLSLNSNGQIALTSTNILKNNLAEYLVPYRMVNDFVEINDAFVINFSIHVSVLISFSYNASEVRANIIDSLKKYFNINLWQINQRLYIAKITDLVMNLPGVINVIDVKISNVIGGNYSSIQSSQADGEKTTVVGSDLTHIIMTPINNEILSGKNTILELRYPNQDITVSTVFND